jgi:DNA-binding response OmpR family regulator
MLKRGGVQEEKAGALIVGKLVVDLMRHQVSIDNRRISPTQMELKLLVFLMKRCGYVLTRDQFLDGAGEIGSNVNPRTIDTHIKRLRKKLGVHQSMIETVRGIGYRLCEDEEQ